MTKKTIVIFIFIGICLAIILPNFNIASVRADELTDSIEEQLSNIDLSKLETYFQQLENKPNENFLDWIYGILKGEFSLNFNSIFSSIVNVFFNKVVKIIPIFISVIAISIFCGLTQNFKSSFVAENISDIIFFICFLSILLLLSAGIIDMYHETKNTIKNISKLTEIMSPIILSLMVASGSAVSASVYKPAVVFLSGGAISVFLSIVLPLIAIMFIFSVVSNLSGEIKLGKYIDFVSGIVKWIIGLTITVFGVFITIQGITSACHDGISLRLAKFTLSNSIPIVGGFVKDGFELIILTSTLLKNAIGLSSVFILFSSILSPIIFMMTFSLMLKLTAAITENVADVRVSNFCTSISKCITYFLASVVLVGFMFFVIILLMILSANSIL